MAKYNADFKQGAVNPYNFVRLGKGVKRDKPFSDSNTGVNTGVIHCSLKTATPLAIPDFPYHTKVKDDNGNTEHKCTDFIKIDGKPVIPGSELRGVIRSAYETLGKDTSQGTLVWFKANHNDGKMVRQGEGCSIGYHLPRISDENKILPALIKSDDYGKSQSYGGTRKNESYSGPTKFEGKSDIKPTTEVRCRYCKTFNSVEVAKNMFERKQRTVVCKKCGKTFTTDKI